MLITGPFLTAASIDLPAFLWLGSVALIPLGMLWWLGLGAVLLVKSRPHREQKPVNSAA